VLHYDGNGQLLWAHHFAGTGEWNNAIALAVGPDHAPVVVGMAFDGKQRALTVIKYNP